MNRLPIAILSSSGTFAHDFCASAAERIAASSSASEGYVRVTKGCWLCGVIVVWDCADIVLASGTVS